MIMGTAARRKRAQERTFRAAQHKAERPITKTETIKGELTDWWGYVRSSGLTKDVVKEARDNWYRQQQVGIDFKKDDTYFYAFIEEGVTDPDRKFIILFFQGKAPGYLDNVPLWVAIKKPSVPTAERANVIPCGKFSQFCVATIVYGDADARKHVAELVKQMLDAPPICERELEYWRAIYTLCREWMIEKQGVSDKEAPSVNQMVANRIGMRLFPECDPDEVQRIARTLGMTYDGALKAIKKDNKEIDEQFAPEHEVVEKVGEEAA
jgi:hypothetical protein